MDKQLLIAESLMDMMEISLAEISQKNFSEEECKEQCRKVRSFIKRYRARDEKISRLMLQPEWQEMRQYAFLSKTEVH